MDPPSTKASILSQGIQLVRSLLSSQANGHPGKLSLHNNSSSSLDSPPESKKSKNRHTNNPTEPYWLLFRKSGTPLAMCRPDDGHFIDW